jgi:DNA-binding XRE family transcriptional regulator
MDGGRMRELRRMAGLTQGEVAAELHLHPVTICTYEKRNKELTHCVSATFLALVNDVERVHWIKNMRRARRLSERQRKLGAAFGVKGHENKNP